ncbi:MAG: DUF2062 domain-containing protein [Sphingobacteriia bacterium]|nr:DUF2062 domain-containing protein [Sphingobacteriia bacterium]NCC38549.1 DUF2062 domain-containing protein [Gammaproteobacteria bacterium]
MKRWLKRNLPAPAAMRANRHVGLFGRLLHDPNLWHLNRRSVASGVAVGLFVMFLPPLGQTLLAAALAILFRVNLPIAVMVSLITNPLTIPPIYYTTYNLGCWVLGITPERFDLDFWLDWQRWQAVIWPVTLGGLICGALCAALGYVLVQLLWRWRLTRQIRLRRARYQSVARDRRPSSKRQI